MTQLTAQNDVLAMAAGSAAAASGLLPKDVVRQLEGAPLKEPLATLLGKAEYAPGACPELVLAVSSRGLRVREYVRASCMTPRIFIRFNNHGTAHRTNKYCE